MKTLSLLFRRRWFQVCSLAFVLASVLSVTAQQQQGSIRDLLDASRTRHKIPGMVLVATRGDEVLDIAVSGVRRQGDPERISPNDLFHIGSNAKAITATVLAMRVEDGRLSWDSKPAMILAEAGRPRLQDYKEVTLIGLLAHQSGVPVYDDTDSPEFRRLTTPSTPVIMRSFCSFIFAVFAEEMGC